MVGVVVVVGVGVEVMLVVVVGVMNRATPEKVSQRERAASGVEAYLAAGNEIQQIEGFGVRPKLDESLALMASPNTLPKSIYDEIDKALELGETIHSVFLRFGVSHRTVQRRKEVIVSRQLRKAKELAL